MESRGSRLKHDILQAQRICDKFQDYLHLLFERLTLQEEELSKQRIEIEGKSVEILKNKEWSETQDIIWRQKVEDLEEELEKMHKQHEKDVEMFHQWDDRLREREAALELGEKGRVREKFQMLKENVVMTNKLNELKVDRKFELATKTLAFMERKMKLVEIGMAQLEIDKTRHNLLLDEVALEFQAQAHSSRSDFTKAICSELGRFKLSAIKRQIRK